MPRARGSRAPGGPPGSPGHGRWRAAAAAGPWGRGAEGAGVAAGPQASPGASSSLTGHYLSPGGNRDKEDGKRRRNGAAIIVGGAVLRLGNQTPENLSPENEDFIFIMCRFWRTPTQSPKHALVPGQLVVDAAGDL
ncbi:uncharacterized protein LOC144288899 [Canis aureus]